MFSRPPPPRGAPPSYAFVNRVYKRSLRPVVISVGALSALWSLIWGIASFRDISIDKDHAARLEVFDIVLGAMYIATCVLELFGVAAAAKQSLPLVRVYSFLSLGAAVIVTAAQLIRVVIHFAFKSELINECIALATGQTVITRFGIWGPTSSTTLSPNDASNFCNDAWSHDSFSEIAWFIVVAILGFLFSSITFAYYRQLIDPTSPANQARAPSAQARAAAAGGGAYPPPHYNPPYASGGVDVGGSVGNLSYAPPPGPPPPGAASSVYVPEYDPAKLPAYGESNESGDLGLERDKKGADPFADFDRVSEGHAGRRDGNGNV